MAIQTQRWLMASLLMALSANGQATSTRALGMGGAFVAQANDVSGIPINPAGMASLTERGVFEFALEGNQILRYNNSAETPETENMELTYLGAMLSAFDTGLGLYWSQDAKTSPVSVHNTTDMAQRGVLGMGAGKGFYDGTIKLGATIDWPAYTLESQNHTSSSAGGYTIGTIIQLADRASLSAHSGLQYSLSAGVTQQSDIEDDRILNRAESLRYGVSMALSGLFGNQVSRLTLNGEVEQTDIDIYRNIEDLKTYKLGAEWTFFSIGNEHLQYTVRSGIRQFDEQDLSNALSFGAGLNWKSHTIEVAGWQEPSEDFDDYLVGLSYTFSMEKD